MLSYVQDLITSEVMMKSKSSLISLPLVFLILSTTMGCSEPLTKREQGGLLGAGLGAGTGAIIGSTVGHAAVGALIGGPIGLIGGALIGDQLMGQDKRQQEQQQQIEQNSEEIQRLRNENQRLREQ
ncbi:MAG TPA: glycine zipper domain-containing protein [Acidobacteriota bacterium]|nr:glycine zipper domain-containing protein [Acidobacteriota bacterium]